MARTGTAPALNDITPELFVSDQIRDNGKGIKTVWCSKVPNGRADDRFRFTTIMNKLGALEDVDPLDLPLVKFAPQSFPGEHPNMSVEMGEEMLGFFQTLDSNNTKLITARQEMWGLPKDFNYHPVVKPPKEEKYKPLVTIKIQDAAVMEPERKDKATNVYMVQNGEVVPTTIDKITRDARCMIVAEMASMWFNPRRAEVGAKIVAQEIMVWPSATNKRGLDAFPFDKDPKVAKTEATGDAEASEGATEAATE